MVDNTTVFIYGGAAKWKVRELQSYKSNSYLSVR